MSVSFPRSAPRGHCLQVRAASVVCGARGRRRHPAGAKP